MIIQLRRSWKNVIVFAVIKRFLEFTAFDVLTNEIFTTSYTTEKMKLRVPLSFKIQYKGFTAIVVAKPPISYTDTMTIIHGHSNKGEFFYDHNAN